MVYVLEKLCNYKYMIWFGSISIVQEWKLNRNIFLKKLFILPIKIIDFDLKSYRVWTILHYCSCKLNFVKKIGSESLNLGFLCFTKKIFLVGQAK